MLDDKKFYQKVKNLETSVFPTSLSSSSISPELRDFKRKKKREINRDIYRPVVRGG